LILYSINYLAFIIFKLYELTKAGTIFPGLRELQESLLILYQKRHRGILSVWGNSPSSCQRSFRRIYSCCETAKRSAYTPEHPFPSQNPEQAAQISYVPRSQKWWEHARNEDNEERWLNLKALTDWWIKEQGTCDRYPVWWLRWDNHQTDGLPSADIE
jgi:hypothetical protein